MKWIVMNGYDEWNIEADNYSEACKRAIDIMGIRIYEVKDLRIKEQSQ